MMLSGLVLGAVLTMWLFPEVPIGRSLRRVLVHPAAAWLDGAKRHHIICLVVVAALLLSPAAIETMMMLHMADLSLFAWALDVSLYIDIVAVGVAVAAASRARVALTIVRAIVAKRRSGPQQVQRSRRPRAARRPQARSLPGNDDEPAGIPAAA